MIPLRDVIPSRRAPLVSLALIAASLAGFALGPWLTRAAAGVPPLALLASIVVHDRWPTLVVDLLFLWLFGENVEDRLGRVRFLLLFLAGGLVAAALGSTPSVFQRPPAGATGAMAGLLAAYAALFPRSRVLVLVPLPIVFDVVEVPAVYLLTAWFGTRTAIALTSPARLSVALLPLAAGALTGLAGVWLLGGMKRRTDYWKAAVRIEK